MTKRKLTPYDGIHTCSKGCSKPGCTRTLRDTIEEQDQQIEALKRDVLEQAAEVRQLRFKSVHDIHHIREQCEEIARLKAEVERLRSFTTRTIIPNEELQAQIERLTKAGDAMLSEWASGDEKDAKNFLKALIIWNAAKDGKQP